MRSKMQTHRTGQKLVSILSKRYPISRRLVIKRVLPWLSVFSGLGCFVLAVRFNAAGQIGFISSMPAVQQILLLLLSAAFLIFIGKLVYEILWRTCYYYAIEDSNLVISKGILIRQRGSFPLSRITDVYLNRSFSDFIFGLYNLNVSTPTEHSGEFAEINGLSKQVAIQLQNLLTRTLEEVEHRFVPQFIERVSPEGELPVYDPPLPLPPPPLSDEFWQ